MATLRYVYHEDAVEPSFAIAADGSLSLEDATAGTAVGGEPGLRDEDLSGDGRFLYALDADGHPGTGGPGDQGPTGPRGPSGPGGAFRHDR